LGNKYVAQKLKHLKGKPLAVSNYDFNLNISHIYEYYIYKSIYYNLIYTFLSYSTKIVPICQKISLMF